MAELIVFGTAIGVSMGVSLTVVGVISMLIMMQPRFLRWAINSYGKSLDALEPEEVNDD